MLISHSLLIWLSPSPEFTSYSVKQFLGGSTKQIKTVGPTKKKKKKKKKKKNKRKKRFTRLIQMKSWLPIA
jgi:hypothetical protein